MHNALASQVPLCSQAALPHNQMLMELGDWKSYEMVLRYAHLAPDHLSHAAARIERALEIVEPNSTKTLRFSEETTHANA